jgi:hypothetical protein
MQNRNTECTSASTPQIRAKFRLYRARRSANVWFLAVALSRLMLTRLSAIGYRLSAIGYRLLAIGYWLLAIGYWLLAIGYLLIGEALGSFCDQFSFARFLAVAPIGRSSFPAELCDDHIKDRSQK